eukprot:317182-Prorocentrum_lima.AAC.1
MGGPVGLAPPSPFGMPLPSPFGTPSPAPGLGAAPRSADQVAAGQWRLPPMSSVPLPAFASVPQ